MKRIKRWFWAVVGLVCLLPILPFFIISAACNAVDTGVMWLGRERAWSKGDIKTPSF